MSLRRSTAGIGSMHIFLRADKIVYCEGGQNIRREDLTLFAGRDDTHDVQFWTHVGRHLQPQRRHHVKSVGCKQTLKSIASDLNAAGITTVAVCLDSDFDHHCNSVLNYSNVAYTFGYSWENDVVRAPALSELFFLFVPRNDKTLALLSEANSHISAVTSELTPWCEVDLSLVHKGKGALFVRSNPLSLHVLSKERPKLDKAKIRGRLGALGYKRAPTRKVRLTDTDYWRHACGKVIARLAYHIMVAALKSFNRGINIDYDNFMRICISQTFAAMERGELNDMKHHFQKYSNTFS